MKFSGDVHLHPEMLLSYFLTSLPHARGSSFTWTVLCLQQLQHALGPDKPGLAGNG